MGVRSVFMRAFRSVFREQKTRLQIDWLSWTDERILEYLETVDEDRPITIARELDRSTEYVSDRCRQLAIRGLLESLDERPGADRRYRLTDLGQQYLNGELTAEELEDAVESIGED